MSSDPRTPEQIEADVRRAVAADLQALAEGVIAHPRTDRPTAKVVAVVLGLAVAVAQKGLK